MVLVVTAACETWTHPLGNAANTSHNGQELAFDGDLSGMAPRWTATGVEAVVGTDGMLVAHDVTADRVATFEVDGGTDCTVSAVPTCSPAWTAPGRPLAAAGGRVYADLRVATGAGDGGEATTIVHQVVAYDLRGVAGCSGGPVECAPLWASETLGPVHEVRVVGGRLYVSNNSPVGTLVSGWDDISTPCPGGCPADFVTEPRSGPGTPSLGQFAVADGLVFFVATDGLLAAYDAAGQQGCQAGTLRLCQARWRYDGPLPFGGTPVVGGGRVYVAYDEDVLYPGYVPYHALLGFDSRPDLSSCAASTVPQCPQTWSGVLPASSSRPTGEPVLVADRLLVGLWNPLSDTLEVFTYSTAGPGCADVGGVLTCQRLRRTESIDHTDSGPAAYDDGHVSAGGRFFTADDGAIAAFSNDGSSSCTGFPEVCTPLWSTAAATNPVLVSEGYLAAESTSSPGDLVVYSP